MLASIFADRTRRAVAIFTLGYLVGTMVYALKIGNTEFLYYGAIMMSFGSDAPAPPAPSGHSGWGGAI